MNITHKNHYLPCVYLKHFANAQGTTSTYRLLVSRPRVKEWHSDHISAVGYHRDLYTRFILGTETDDFELWLNKKFETPAESVLAKVHTNEEIGNPEWDILVEFLACQRVRTPAFFKKMLPRWHQLVPLVLNKTVAEVDAAILWSKITGEAPIVTQEAPTLKDFPLKVQREDVPEEKVVRFRTEIAVGRSLWLSTMNLLLTHSIRFLHNHHWSIFHGAPGMNFFTSDDPVIQLNYRTHLDYDFNGGWGSKGTEILFPLSPRHIMYTKIGDRFPPRGLLLTESETDRFRQMIAKHAHRYIFALKEDAEVPNLRPRAVNPDLVEFEKKQWQHWHQEQIAAENRSEPRQL